MDAAGWLLQESHNSIAAQLLNDERIFAAMQGMLAKMVWQQFKTGRVGDGGQ